MPKSKIQEEREKLLAGIQVPEKVEFRPDDFQIEATESVAQGNDTLVIAPTGTGKTYIAVESISRTLKDGKRAIYTAPLKALSNAKYLEFKQRFEPEYRVGLLTGDRKIETDAQVLIATTEIYRNELFSFSEEYGVVVLDEFHYLSDPQRGAVWEESIVLSPRSSALLMLSASISNPDEIAEWIRSIRSKEVRIISVEERPVELRFGFLHPRFGVIPLMNEKGQAHEEVENFYKRGPKSARGEFGMARRMQARKGRSSKGRRGSGRRKK